MENTQGDKLISYLVDRLFSTPRCYLVHFTSVIKMSFYICEDILFDINEKHKVTEVHAVNYTA